MTGLVKNSSTADTVVALVRADFGLSRKQGLINSVGKWCESRQLNLLIKQPEELEFIDLDRVVFFYGILTGTDWGFFESLPKEIPVVLDTATPIRRVPEGLLASDRKVALRKAFGTSEGDLVAKQVVPMIPPPKELGATISERNSSREKDVIVVDTKPFHEASAILEVASLLSSLMLEIDKCDEILNSECKFYFTSFMPDSLFTELIRYVESHEVITRESNTSVELENRLLPSGASNSDYSSILDRCALFITEHGDLADFDLVQVLTRGQSAVALYKRNYFSESNGFQSTLDDALDWLSPGLKINILEMESARVTPQQGVIKMLKSSPPQLDRVLYEKAYLKSWDVLLEFSTTGRIDNRLNDLVRSGKGWNKGLRKQVRK